MPKALQSALLCAGLTATPAIHAERTPEAILETRFLILPNKPVTGVGAVPPASDFRATVGNKKFEVRAVTRAADSSDLKTVIVFDLASIPRDGQLRLVDQARAMEPGLRRMRNVSLFVVSYEWTEFHNAFGTAGEQYEYFLPEPGSAAGDRGAPPPSPRPEFLKWTEGQAVYGPSIQSFRGLARVLQNGRGPIRVLWIGQDFGWVHPDRQYIVGGRSPFYAPNAAFGRLDAFTQAGIDFWPIVWLDGLSEQAEGPRRNLKQAWDLAQYLGGEASVCSTDLAACLKSVLERSMHGWIIRIAGPPVDWTGDSAQVLNLWYAPDRSVLDLTRPFVRLEKPRLKLERRQPGVRLVPIWREVAPAVPLFDSVALLGKPGCGAVKGSATEKLAMTAIVPDAVVRGLQTYVEVLSVSSGPAETKLSAQQRRAAMLSQHLQFRTRSAPELVRETGQGTAEVCVDLPPTSQIDWSYWIILFNPEAGWAGVGFLPVADVVRTR